MADSSKRYNIVQHRSSGAISDPSSAGIVVEKGLEQCHIRVCYYKLKREGGVLEADIGKRGISFFDGKASRGSPSNGSFLGLGTSALLG